MKVFLLPAGEDWVVDRFVDEWKRGNTDITVDDPRNADVLWILAGWCWRKLPLDLLTSKKSIVTVHHIVPEKFDDNKINEFLIRDKFISEYHVYNKVTYDIVSNLTNRPINLVPYWANQHIWKKTDDKFKLRQKFGLPVDSFLIGSFQRDTEGADLASPKMEKGPDLFVDYVMKMHSKNGGVHVVLAGWRRQYVLARLEAAGINFTYIELPSQEILNELYQTLDVYPVTSRQEGGPQALIECGLIGIPTVSRDVGIASQVLPVSSIADDVSTSQASIPSVNDWKLPMGFVPYRNMIERLYKNESYTHQRQA